MDHDTVLSAAEGAIDTLIDSGAPHGGLFPSMLDRESGEMLEAIPEQMPGQREHDRAHHGNNLLHDEPILRTMYALAESEGHGGYGRAADGYLETFAVDCTAPDHEDLGEGTATGLFPWGEHAYWHLEEQRVAGGREYGSDGDTGPVVHDHLRLVPEWLWEKIHEYNPAAVHRFADGLEYHYNDPKAPEYIRHAYVNRKARYSIGERSCDFPRHGGHYIYDWAFAYTTEQHPEYLRRIENMADYWWQHRTDWDLLTLESRGRTEEINLGQTVSLAISLLDAADLLAASDPAPDVVDTLQDRAATYLDALFAAPHDLENGVFLSVCRPRDIREGTFEPRTGTEVEIRPLSIWASVYGSGPAAPRALQYLCGYRHTGEDRLLEWAVAVGDAYRENPFPAGGEIPVEEANVSLAPSVRRTMDDDAAIPVVAETPGHALGLYADLYDLTGEDRWLAAGGDLAETVLDVFFDAPLPRGAATVDHYENQLGTGYLIYNLARIAVLDRDGRDCALGPDYTVR